MLYAIIVTLVLVADQWLKYWVTVNITLGTGQMQLIPGIVKLVNIHNSGMSFGLFSDSPIAKWVFIGLAGAFVVLVIVVLAKKVITSRFGAWCAVFAVAGAVGNCIDRLLYGYVVDMFKLEFVSFAVFNIADIVLCISCLLFIIFLFVGEKDKEEKPAKAAKTAKPVPEPAAEEVPETEDYEQPERKLKIKLKKQGDDKVAATSFDSAFDFFDKTDPEEEQRRLQEDEEFWSALKHATGKGEKPNKAKLPEEKPAEPEPVITAEPEPEKEEMPEIKIPEEKPEKKTDDFDLDSILAEFKDL